MFSIKKLNCIEIDSLWFNQLDKSKDSIDNEIKNIVWLKNLKTIYIYIYIYWDDKILNRLTYKISTQVMRPQQNHRKQIKKILKVNSQSTDCWRMKLKKSIKKEQKKTPINLSNLNHKIEIT